MISDYFKRTTLSGRRALFDANLFHADENCPYHPAVWIILSLSVIRFTRDQGKPVQYFRMHHGINIAGANQAAASYFICVHLPPGLNLNQIAVFQILEVNEWPRQVVGVPHMPGQYGIACQVGNALPSR